MNLSRSDLEAIWNRFVQNTRSHKDNRLTPIKNLIGSAEHHKKIFMETAQEYVKLTCTHQMKHVDLQTKKCTDCGTDLSGEFVKQKPKSDVYRTELPKTDVMLDGTECLFHEWIGNVCVICGKHK